MRYLLVILFLISTTVGFGQKKAIIPDWEISTYRDSKSEDFGDNKIILKDSLGYIWTFNSTSIEKFDGNKFKSYFTYDDFNGENDVRYVHGMHVARDGEVYALSGSGLFRYNRAKDQFERMMENFEPYAEGQLPEFIWMVDQDSIFYISSFVGLYSYHKKTNTYQYFDLRPDEEHRNAHHSPKVVWNIEQDKYQPNIINVFGKGIYHRFDTRTNTILKTLGIGHFKKLSIHRSLQTGPNEFYLSSFGSGVVRFNPELEETEVLYNVSNKYINNKQFRVTFSSTIIK